jgi:WD40 repeat protein
MKPIWILAIALLLSACVSNSQIPGIANPTVVSSETLISTSQTIAPTDSPTPTQTTVPVETPTTPALAPISPENLFSLVQLHSIAIPDTREVLFSKNGNFFAATSGNQTNFGAIAFDSISGNILHNYQPYDGIVWGLDISKDDLWLATTSSSSDKQGITIWNLTNNQLLVKLNQPSAPDSVAFSPDGSVLAIGGVETWPNGVIWMYDAETWTPLQKMDAPGQNVLALKFSPDGNILASAGTDGKIRIWNPRNGSLVQTLFHANQANSIAFSPGGELLTSTFCSKSDATGCTEGGVVVWRTSDWRIMQTFSDLAETVAFSVDGKLLVTGSGANDPQIRFRRTIDWLTIYSIQESSNAVAFNKDGTRFLTANWNEIKQYVID